MGSFTFTTGPQSIHQKQPTHLVCNTQLLLEPPDLPEASTAPARTFHELHV